jgi:ribonuclease R
MADKIGATFAARISGVARFGLFVTLLETGANGLLPLSSLPDDYWMHDETTQTLNGRRTRQSFRLAQELSVRLKEASPVTGGLIFELGDAAPGKHRQRGAQADGRGQRGVHAASRKEDGVQTGKPDGGRKRGRR